jgi:adenylyl-sulfate kinase
MIQLADQFQVRISWLGPLALIAGRSYFLQRGVDLARFTVTAIKYRVQPENGQQLSASRINAGEDAVINISTDILINIDTAKECTIQILDGQSRQLLGRGIIEFALHRATNIRWQQLTINKQARAILKHQCPRCIWFTGLSGSGKSTIANLLEKRLYEQGLHTYLLDGDNLRHGLNRDLGFTEADRVENIRRVSEVARLMVDAGLVTIASFISPYIAERVAARKLFAAGEFVEVFVDTPLHECEKRDVKGLYAKARRGELKNFTGVDSAYEPPEQAELVLDTCHYSAEDCVEQIVNFLRLSESK